MPTKAIPALIAALALSACGTQQGDRTLSGAGVGAATGAVAGPIGVGVGAVVGAVGGYATDKDDVYLGKPVWKNQKSSSKKRKK
jgi:osmotically inducible lipoprotein OsmB